jgi:hypothetical protein
MNKQRCRASGCGGRGMFAPASHLGWLVGVRRWSAQAAGYGDLVGAGLVAKDYARPKARVNATLIQGEKVLP